MKTHFLEECIDDSCVIVNEQSIKYSHQLQLLDYCRGRIRRSQT